MSVPLTPSADKNWITARWACLEESMARSLTVISLLLQSTTHRRYRVYTKFLLTYTANYRVNRKVPPLGITALQPQSRFHLGTPYTSCCAPYDRAIFSYIVRLHYDRQSFRLPYMSVNTNNGNTCFSTTFPRRTITCLGRWNNSWLVADSTKINP